MHANQGLRLLPIAAAVLGTMTCAQAQTSDEVKALITPESSATIGVGGVNRNQDAKRFGEYNGMNRGDAYGLIDFTMIKRDDTTGTWLTVQGRNLGLETRELSASGQHQGDWKYTFEYNEMIRHDPYVIHTGMRGIGTASPTIVLINKPPMPAAWASANFLGADPGVAGSDVDLKIKRTALGVSAEKRLTPELSIEGSARTEDRQGARLFGRGGLDSSDMGLRPTNNVANPRGSWAVLLTPEPIKSRTNLLDGKLNFQRGALAVTGGYYGSFFMNDYGALTPVVPGTLDRGALWSGNTAAGASTVAQLASATVALPPDNQAHQLYVSGTYAFSKLTRANFKLSYTHATQDENFRSQSLTPSALAPASLGGVLNTTLAQGSLTSRLTNSLTLNARLRYEDRQDKTPINVYNANGVTGSALNGSTNWPSATQTRTTLAVDGTYRFAQGYTGVLGLDWERKKAPPPVVNSAIFANQVFFRPQLDEYGVRAELRKALSETLNGSLGVEMKQRRGGDGDWVTTGGTSNALVSVTPATLNRVLPDMYMDRDRAKARGTIDWSPLERFDLQVVLDHTVDEYKRDFSVANAPYVPGARTISVDSASFDGAYRITDDWKLAGYFTVSRYRWNVNKASLYEDTRNRSHTAGLTLTGQLTRKLAVGADAMTTTDSTSFTNLCAPSASCINGAIVGFGTLPGNYLPGIHYQTDRLKVFANYALDPRSDVRVDVIYQHFHTDDWQWGYNGVPFLYSDNTTVSQPMTQNAVFIGARYGLRF